VKKKLNKDKVSSLGWSGRWLDGRIGWRTSRFVAEYPSQLDTDQREYGGPYERVRITVEVVKDRRGRKIVRRGRPYE
jgi:hypothetical protein